MMWIKTLLLSLTLSFIATTALAQKGLEADKVFTHYGHAKGCKMVVMNNVTYHNYRLTVYKSLTYKHIGAEVRQLLQADRKRAKKIREIVEDGEVAGGYYMMQPSTNGDNRFILFKNGEGERGVLIYIEGELSAQELLDIFHTFKNKQ